MTESESLMAAREHAERAWCTFLSERHGLPDAGVDAWHVGTAPDGSPYLSGRMVGRSSAEALRVFATDHPMGLSGPGDQRPGYDYTTPGRVACVWRKCGVWVELWHPETLAPCVPAHETASAASGVRRVLARPSGRLPFTRRSKTPKETSTA